MRYTMMQVCKETGMTYQALKFYCNEGLVPNVKRDKNNRRVFDERDVAWISSLTRLKKCGMGIQEMKDYLALCLQGERTIPQRKILLAQKQEALRAGIRELQDSVAYIGWKQNFYDEVLSGKRPYESNLIRVEKYAQGWRQHKQQAASRSVSPPACIPAVFHPSATSSTIIRLKPTAKNTVPMLECAPCDISGISSSTTT